MHCKALVDAYLDTNLMTHLVLDLAVGLSHPVRKDFLSQVSSSCLFRAKWHVHVTLPTVCVL
jgi:hypothetical protein